MHNTLPLIEEADTVQILKVKDQPNIGPVLSLQFSLTPEETKRFVQWWNMSRTQHAFSTSLGVEVGEIENQGKSIARAEFGWFQFYRAGKKPEDVQTVIQQGLDKFTQLPPPPEKPKRRTADEIAATTKAIPPLDRLLLETLQKDVDPYLQEWWNEVVDANVEAWQKYQTWADAQDEVKINDKSPITGKPYYYNGKKRVSTYLEEEVYKKNLRDRDVAELVATDILAQWQNSGYQTVDHMRPRFEKMASEFTESARLRLLQAVWKYLPKGEIPVNAVEHTTLNRTGGKIIGVWLVTYEDGSRKQLDTQMIWAGGYNIQRLHTRYLVHVQDITPVTMHESQEPQPTQEMVDWFNERTRRHIALAQKYGAAIAEAFPEYSSLPDEMRDHDASKFTEPEYTPYVFMTWQKKHSDFKPPDSVNIQATTLHHVVNNSHHPESWSPNPAINAQNRDAPPAEIVDATRMPEIAIAEMCADWAAMGEELGNSPLDWAESQIGKRWRFTVEQEALIYTLLEAIWNPPPTDLQEEGLFSKKPVVYTGDVKTPKVNPQRFTAPAQKLSPQNEFGGLYGVLSMALPWGPKKKTEIWDIIYQRVKDRYWTTAFQGRKNKQGDFREIIRDFLDSQYGASIGGDLLAAARYSEFMLYKTAQECSMRSWDAYWRNYLRYCEWD